MSEQPRPVFVTAEQRRALGSLEDFWASLAGEKDWRLPHIEAMRRAWDAAPADPAEAILAAVKTEVERSLTSSKRMPFATWVTTAVLRALGFPGLGDDPQDAP